MELQFFIKFTRAEWAEEIKNEGKLFFNPAYKFFSSPHYSSGQYDPWDSHVNMDVKHLVYAPIIQENKNGIKYGQGKVLADEARVHYLDNRNKKIPICCFRMVFSSDIKDSVLRFDNKLYEQVRNEFPQYNYFVLFCFPNALFDMLKKSKWGDKAYGQGVRYGDAMGFDRLKLGEEKETANKYPYLQMFNKEEQFSYQQEFRLILPTEQWDEGGSIEIGSLEHVVVVGKIEQLKAGYRFKKYIKNDMCYFEFEEIV